ncbi:hypothetical protein EalM132_00179 [Exiguobacterium phage vB_EalM-132]|nr:hypothetical protein EalM132_00009 [Exiguobacterium phage vB_EalM-132]AYP68691.1 hypothetical protein EalM132_00179 [Exiguobacterium phage vB_EalM-132]
MNQAVLVNRVVREVRQLVESEDISVGISTVVGSVVITVEEAIAYRTAKYGELDEEDMEMIEGATHMVRFVMVDDADLVDGDDWYFKVTEDAVELITEPDHPAYYGGEFNKAMEWLAEITPEFAR